MGKDDDRRPKALIIGADFTAFQLCWNDFNKRKIRIYMLIKVPPSYLNSKVTQSEIEEASLEDPPIIRKAKDNIRIGQLEDLEKIILMDKIDRCLIHTQSVPMNCIKSIVFRIMSVGKCAIEYIQPKEISISSCKPIVTVSSLAEKCGKTQFVRYCTKYLCQFRKIAVIIPIVQVNDKIIQLISDQKKPKKTAKEETNKNDKLSNFLYSNDERPSFEFLNFEEALKQREWLSDKILSEIEDYFKSGAFCVYATANINKALMLAERRAHIIFYDSNRSEIPYIKTDDHVCVVSHEVLNNIDDLSQWPGLVNLNNSQKKVFIQKGTVPINDDLKQMLTTIFKYKPVPKQNQKKKIRRKNFFVNSITEDEASVIGASDDDNGSNSGSNIPLSNNYNSANSELASSNVLNLNNSNTVKIASNNNNNSNEDDYSMNIISLPQDLTGHDPNIPIIFPTIYDFKDSIRDWLSSFFISLFTPPLQRHFEAQVGIIKAMNQTSEKELCVTNHTSANRGAFCRLFLSSHLPPSFRVTNGEILDAKGNKTGQLEVVIVNDSAPYMTIGASNAVIAPILADTVLCVVEVKTLIDPENLRKALSQLRPVKALMPMHGTLETPEGEVIPDPLGGKILTGIFGFNMNNETIDKAVPEILNIYPNVVDFIVIPNKFGYFLVETLKVCGIDANLSKSKIVNGYVRYDADGIELALIFGILNSIAAKRRFSGSNCVRYLSGKWEKDIDH